ncbi:MAG: glycosyltransferase, partial [Bacteriovoracaceae bacterium]|nr:glycosyltransferase [Bacteriovoracaceae bacterium]
DPFKYYSISDIFCLPSYREGFGSVILEAAALKVPAVGSNIYGVKDAILHGKTGLLFPVKSTSELKSALDKLLNDEELRTTMGKNAYQRVVDSFSSAKVSRSLNDTYQKLLKENLS